MRCCVSGDPAFALLWGIAAAFPAHDLPVSHWVLHRNAGYGWLEPCGPVRTLWPAVSGWFCQHRTMNEYLIYYLGTVFHRVFTICWAVWMHCNLKTCTPSLFLPGGNGVSLVFITEELGVPIESQNSRQIIQWRNDFRKQMLKGFKTKQNKSDIHTKTIQDGKWCLFRTRI